MISSLSTSPYPETGYWLLHEGARALAIAEARGIRIDESKLQASKKECTVRIRQLESEIRDDPVGKEWRRRFGVKTNYAAPAQLGTMLFEYLKLEGGVKTVSGQWSTDAKQLQKVQHPFLEKCNEAARLRKLRDTFLKGIERELCEGFLHPSFNLNIARSFRSSSSDPNFQNLPIRSGDSARIIRECFIPRDGRMLIEADFGSIEVRVAACYHKDPTMITYIEDPTKDMHRDMAAQIYQVQPDQVSKMARHAAKNLFVFPEFYGDYYVSCAKSLWDAITLYSLQVGDKPMQQHLKSCGIKSLGACNPKERPVKGTFEHWVKEVEDDFWNTRFLKYTKWKKSWYAKYQQRGYFDMLSGFRVANHHGRKEVINYPVQGSAFHCLLWALITMTKLIRERRMQTYIVGQIHDSIIADVPENEVADYLALVREVMIDRLMATWGWIIVPLTVEAEGSYENWYAKKALELK